MLNFLTFIQIQEMLNTDSNDEMHIYYLLNKQVFFSFKVYS